MIKMSDLLNKLRVKKTAAVITAAAVFISSAAFLTYKVFGAEPVYSNDFESAIGDFIPSGFPNTSASVTHFYDTVINGSGSLYLNGAGAWNDCAYIFNHDLAGGNTYTVSFKYKVLRALPANGQFVMFVRTWGSIDSSDIDLRWDNNGNWIQGESKNVTSATFVKKDDYYEATIKFTTNAAKANSFIYLSMNGSASMTIDDFKIYQGDETPSFGTSTVTVPVKPTTTENFDGARLSYKFWDARADGANVGITTETGRVIEGTTSAKYTSASEATVMYSDWGDPNFGYTAGDPKYLRLKGNTDYTATMVFKANSATGMDSDFNLILGNGQGDWHDDQYVKFNKTQIKSAVGILPSDACVIQIADNTYELSMRFTTKDTIASFFKLWIQGAFDFNVDCFQIFETKTLTVTSWFKPYTTPNGLVYSDDFESSVGGFAKMPYDVASAYRTRFYDDVINGSSSLLVNNSGSGWADCAVLDKIKYPVLANTTYTTAFKFKPVRSIAAGQSYILLVKSASSAPDYFILSWDNSGNVISHDNLESYSITKNGDNFEVKAGFTTKNLNDYTYMLSLSDKGSMSIDDFVLYKGTPTITFAPTMLRNPSRYIAKEDFEGDRLSYKFWDARDNSGSATVTNEADKLIEGTSSVRYSKASGGTMMFSDWNAANGAKALPLSPLTTYTAAMVVRYNTANPPLMNFCVSDEKETVRFQNDQYITFKGTQITEYKKLTADDVCIRQINDNTYEVSITFTTYNTDASFFNIYAHDAYDFDVDSFRLFKTGTSSITPYNTKYQIPTGVVYSESFENGAGGFSSMPYPVVSADTTRFYDLIINGSSSLVLNNSSSSWADCAILDSNLYPIEANTLYTVMFKYKPVRALANGASNILLVKSANKDSDSILCGWSGTGVQGMSQNIESFTSQAADDGSYNIKITFFALDETDYKLMLSMTGSGSMSIDDFALYKGNTNDGFSASSKTAPASTVNKEDFEGNRLSYKFWDARVDRTGDPIWPDTAIAKNSAQTIDMNVSARYSYSKGGTFMFSDWNANNGPKSLPLKPNTDYTATMKIRYNSAFSQDGNMIWFVRDEAVGWQSDRSITFNGSKIKATNKASGGAVQLDANTYEVYITFKTGDTIKDFINIYADNAFDVSIDCFQLFEASTAPVTQWNTCYITPVHEVSSTGFESGKIDDASIVRPYIGSALGSEASKAIDGTYYIKGSYASENYINNWFLASDSRKLELVPDTKYRLTFKARMEDMPAGGFISFKVASPIINENNYDYMRYLGVKQDGTLNGGFTSGFSSNDLRTSVNNGILTVSIDFTTLGADLPLQYFMIGAPLGGTVYIDDVTVSRFDTEKNPAARSGIMSGLGDDGNGIDSYTIGNAILHPFGAGQTKKSDFSDSVITKETGIE